jgi:tRNA(Ile)-lysidine synthase TilS/MesJ
MPLEQGLAVLSSAAQGHNSVIVAISGGADSMLALDLCCRVAASQKNLRVIAWYLHHYAGEIEAERLRILNLAGERARASTNGRFSLLIAKADIERIRRRLRTSWEHAASLTRRRRLRLIARKLGLGELAPAPVVTGHNRSDYFETVSLRKERKIPESALPRESFTDEATVFLRPLAACTRDEIREITRGARIQWFEDPANSDLRFARNRIRSQSLNPVEPGTIAFPELPEFTQVSSREYCLSADDFDVLQPNAQARAVFAAYRRLGVSRRFSRNHFERAQKLPFSLPPFFAHREFKSRQELIVFRRGLAQRLRPASNNGPYVRGDSITRSLQLTTSYGHKSVAKIFSERRLSPRQRRQTIVYLNGQFSKQADCIEFCEGIER